MKLSDYMKSTNTAVREIAEKVGVSRMAVRYWADEKRMPRPELMKRIVEATNGEVTPNDFFLRVKSVDTSTPADEAA